MFLSWYIPTEVNKVYWVLGGARYTADRSHVGVLDEEVMVS